MGAHRPPFPAATPHTAAIPLHHNKVRPTNDYLTGSLADYSVDCLPPEPQAILTRYISQGACRDDPEGMEQRLLELADTPELREALGPSPRPAETVELAGLLIEHGHGEISLKDVKVRCDQFVHRQVTEWFATLHRMSRGETADEKLRLIGFRIALAVLNESPYHDVAEAGEQLAEELMAAISPRRVLHSQPNLRTLGRPLFSDDQTSRLAAGRAQITDSHVRILGLEAQIPAKFVQFSDERFPLAILTHAWQRHHNLRQPLMRWLRKLGQDPSPLVWIRAAQAAGLLCTLDFLYTWKELLVPEANLDEFASHDFVALALDQVVRDEKVRPAVNELLQQWRRHGTENERLTAATARSWPLGLRDIDTSLNELRIIGDTRDEDGSTNFKLTSRAGYSVSRLFTFGAVEHVTDRLAEWIDDESLSLRELAHWAVLRLANTFVYQLLDQQFATSSTGERLLRTREQWPLLLALQDEDPRFTQHFAYLLRKALQGPANRLAEDILSEWLRSCERDRACLDALARFLPYLIHNDMDFRRLLHLVGRLRGDRAEPLRADVATGMEEAIKHTFG